MQFQKIKTNILNQTTHTQRLQSLDVLRGLDLFLLVTLHPLLLAIGEVWDNSYFHAMMHQFDHETWVGFRLWDLIMPLFLFMTGISIPFSLDSKIGGPLAGVYKHLFRRFLILWLLGMVIQGNLLGLEWSHFRLYSNTLQAIAFGYLVSALFYLHTNIKVMLGCSLLFMLLYSLPFFFGSDYSEQQNFAIQLDRAVLGSFMDGVYWDEAGKWHFSASYNYTWIWSSLTFVVTVMMGVFAGKLIKTGFKTAPYRVFQQLLCIGVVCILLAWLISFQMPIIKRIWTVSMTLFSGGICFVLMALFFYMIDIKQWNKPFSWLKIYGLNSIVAYFLGEYLNFRSIVHSLTYGLENIFPLYKALILTTGNAVLIFLILHLLYKNKYFVKI